MNLAIIIASERKHGNSELLGKLTAKYVIQLGGAPIPVYLKDFSIKQCQGCMSCVFKKEKCKIDDDLYKFIENIITADALMLLAPTYVLTIPGKLKMVLDRFLCLYDLIKDKPVRPAVSVAVASPIDYNQFQLPLMNLFLVCLGYRVIESYFVFGAGQGEALLEDGPERIKKSIENLSNFKEKPYDSSISKYCPIDFCNLFERIEDDKFRCPVCLTPALAKEDGFYFDAKDLNNHRWTKDKLKDHFENWISRTKQRFIRFLPDIYKKKKELRVH